MIKKAFILLLLSFSAAIAGRAQQQQPLTPEQKEKQLYEAIQKQVDDYAENLNLEDWQIFYADSILTHNLVELSKEYEIQSKNKVSDSSIYMLIQDTWMEKTYQAFKKILNEEQWQKYLKTGAGRAKKDRDKRAAKAKKKS
ncbi:MAG TPA: hypothetical protein PLU97_04615 [Candidatus Cryptobacteroides sp.]|jgi:hypothetical protein|nr:hypothetical protein [Candidatus Cryptobacteroides sp.]